MTLACFIGSVIGAEYSPNKKLGQYKWVLVVFFTGDGTGELKVWQWVDAAQT